MFTDHDIFQFCYFFRILVQYIVPFRRVGRQVIQIIIGLVAADIHVDQFPRSFAYGLATVQFLEFEIQEFMFLLSFPVFQEGKHADAVHFLLFGFRMDNFFEGR